MTKKYLAAIIIIIAIFLFPVNQIEDNWNDKINIETNEIDKENHIINPVFYKSIEDTINGNKQVINILEINLEDKKVDVKPILSHDSIFGFEETSRIARRHNAKAAINGGFFHSYGQPSGIIITDGKLIRTDKRLKNRPVFIISKDKKAYMCNLDIEVTINIAKTKINIDSVNRIPNDNEIIAFTSEYGLTTRMNGIKSFTIVVNNEEITDFYESNLETTIPPNGIIIVATGDKIKLLKQVSFIKGDNAKLNYSTSKYDGEILNAVECGFWITKEGEIKVKNKEEWVGLTTNREPRTAVAIKDENTVLLMTVDGRQPGYSVGFTGKELAKYLSGLGIKSSLMLDGGGSTTMVVDNKIINNPSSPRGERKVGGAIIVTIKKGN